MTLGHDVWVGHGAVILPGAAVGNGAAIAAGAIVSKDVELFSIVAGVAAKPVRKRFSDEIIDGLQKLAWWDWEHDLLCQRMPDFRNLSAEDFVAKYL